MKHKGFLILGALTALGATGAEGKDIVATEAYRWTADSILQNEFKAYAASGREIRSDYKGRPAYFMPVEQVWKCRNDISTYPVLKTGNRLLEAVYNMGLDEMVNAVEPDTTLRTGKEWAGVWTRDVSYSIILSMAALQPEASKISLMRKVNGEGQIIQDTGSGGAWPVSTDRIVWALAAYEIYKVTGDKEWLRKVYPIVVRSLEKDEKTVVGDDGLVKGETSFIDWREQSYPKWMQTVDISQGEAFGTNTLYAAALMAASEMASDLGKRKEAEALAERSRQLAKAIDNRFWLDDKGYYGMYTYGRDEKTLNPRAESLGHAIGMLYDVIPAEKMKRVSESLPVTPYGPPIFYPQIPDMPNYHNNALWPFVASYWTLAQAKAGNERGVMEGIGSVVRPAALFATNKENLNLDNGDYYTELNSSNMLWSLSGNLALTQRILMGIQFEKNGLRISPFVPESLGETRRLENFPYRGAKLDITVEGYGSKVASLTVNGKKMDPEKVIQASMLKGRCEIKAVMDCRPIAEMSLASTENRKSPLTPVARFVHDEELAAEGVPTGNRLVWNPIEYIAGYKVMKDGKEVAFTRQTSWPATEPGEWQVKGVAGDGTEGFASEPLSNRKSFATEMPRERREMMSSEVCYRPEKGVEGFRGEGFRETDRQSGPIAVEAEIPAEGEYAVYFRYANGNGPVNTENKCAVRTMTVNGVKAGTIVLPQRGAGNWNDWGETNRIRVSLPAGKSEFRIEYLPEDSNMNGATNHALIDRMVIEKR